MLLNLKLHSTFNQYFNNFINREVSSVKNQIRKLEFELTHQKEMTTERFVKDIQLAVDSFKVDFEDKVQLLSDDIRNLQKQRARDKSDNVIISLH